MNNKILYAVIALLLGGVGYLLFFRKKEDDTMNDQAPAPPIPKNTNSGSGPCFEVPTALPAFNNPIVPADAQTYLGLANQQFTEQLGYRILGFFASVDVNPTSERMKFFGKQAILDYLQTPSGQLPHWDVVKGSLRCATQKGFIKYI